MVSRKYPIRPWVSAHAIVFNYQNEILLTKRAAPPKQNYWFPPGGAIDLGETVIEGVSREVFEETNIYINNLRFFDYIDGITHDSEGEVLFHFVVFIFLADYKKGVIKASDDALEAKWLSIEEIKSKKILIPKELLSIIQKI
jgi:8-oxo-dGTP diphosphatase